MFFRGGSSRLHFRLFYFFHFAPFLPDKKHRLAFISYAFALIINFYISFEDFIESRVKSIYESNTRSFWEPEAVRKTDFQPPFYFFPGNLQSHLPGGPFCFFWSNWQVIQPIEGYIQTPPPYPSGRMFVGYLLPTCSPVCT